MSAQSYCYTFPSTLCIAIGVTKARCSAIAPRISYYEINRDNQLPQVQGRHAYLQQSHFKSVANNFFFPEIQRRKNHRLQVSTSESTIDSDRNSNSSSDTVLDSDDHNDVALPQPTQVTQQLQQPKPTNPVLKWLSTVRRFIRPYVLISAVVAVVSVSLLPVTSVADLSPKFFAGLAWASTLSILQTLYGITINQVCDTEIDKINKPYLPIASGDMSMRTAIITTASFQIMSIILAMISGSPALVGFVAAGFYLGSAYSLKLPTLRWKENPILAATYMVSWGGFVTQIPLFMHMQVYVLKRQMVLTKPFVFATAIMSFFSVIVSLVKDLPDVEGDRRNGVQTFAIWFGQERVLKFSVISLMTVYGICMGIGASSTDNICRTVSVLGHAACAAVFGFLSQKVDLKSKSSMNRFYMLIWQLMAAEYFLIHFMR